MYGMNLIFIGAVLFVFIQGTNPDGFISSAQEMWKDQKSKSVILFSLSLMALNIFMLVTVVSTRGCGGAKKYIPFALSWVAVIIAVTYISIELVVTYLWAAVALSISAYSQFKSVICA